MITTQLLLWNDCWRVLISDDASHIDTVQLPNVCTEAHAGQIAQIIRGAFFEERIEEGDLAMADHDDDVLESRGYQ